MFFSWGKLLDTEFFSHYFIHHNILRIHVDKIILNLRAINQNFSNQKLAKEIGYKIPSFSDRLINILQLSKVLTPTK